MNDLFKLVLSLSLSGSIISIIIFITKFIVKNKFSKSWQYYIWFVLVLRLLLPFTVEINLVGSIFEKNQINTVENVTHTEIKLNDTDSNIQPVQTYDDIEVTDESTNYLKLLTSNLWLIWIFGMLILLAIKIVDYKAFINYIKSSISTVEEEDILEIFDDVFIELKLKQNIDIYKSDIIKSPMLIGLFKPFIVIPHNNINLNELKYIFMHELTHFKRLDILYKWIIQILLCVHWFNPLMYFVNRDINKSCELSCDEAVMKILSVEEKNIYGNTLISIAENGATYRNNVASTTLYEDKRILKERLKSIMNFKKISKPTLCISTALIVAIGSISVIVGAAPFKNKITANNNEITKLNQTKEEIDSNNFNQAKEEIDSNNFNQAKEEIDSNNFNQAKEEIDLNNFNQAKEELTLSNSEFAPVNKASSSFDYNSIYSNDKLIASDDINSTAWFKTFWNGYIFNEQEAGLHIGEAHIGGAYTFLDINIKSDFELTAKYKISNNSDDFKIVLVTPDNKVTTIAQAGSGTQKIQLLKGRNRLKMVARNEASASMDFSFNKSEIGNLLSECADLESIISLKSYYDDINKYVSDYINTHNDFSLNSLIQLAPSLNKDILDTCIKASINSQNKVDFEAIKLLAPYMYKETIDFCIQKAIDNNQSIGTNIIEQLAPYSNKKVGNFIEKSATNNVSSNISLDNIDSLAFYANKDSIDSIIKKAADENNIDVSVIKKLAYYANHDAIDYYINKAIDNSIDISVIQQLAPYSNKSSIGNFIEKLIFNSNVSLDGIDALAFYANREDISRIIKKAADRNIDVSVVKKLAYYSNRDAMDYYIDKAIYKNMNLNDINYLAYYASREGIGKIIVKYADNENINFSVVETLAYYSNRDSIADFIDKVLISKKATYKDIQPLLSYIGKDEVNKYIQKYINEILTD